MAKYHIIACDLDGVIVDWNSQYAKLLAAEHGKDLLPQDWKSNPDAFATWNWDQQHGYPPQVIQRVWERDIIRKDNFWSKLKPMPGAIEACHYLNSMSNGGYPIYFLTNRAGIKVKTQTEIWLYEHGINYPTVLITNDHRDKLPIIRALGVEIYMDDRPDTVLDIALAAIEEDLPVKQGLFLKLAAYNRDFQYPAIVRKVDSVKAALVEMNLWKEPILIK